MIKGYTIICNQCNEQIVIKHVDDMFEHNIKVVPLMGGDVIVYCESCKANDTSTTIEI